MKRSLPIVVISDVHLGTHDCHAEELLAYLNSIEVETLIINGDFIDFFQFKKGYFPETHLKVIQKIIKMSTNGTKVYYITGDNDDKLRSFSDISLGNIHLRNQLTLRLNNQKYWIFHGDVFDASIRLSPLLAKMGGKGYDLLIAINRWKKNFRLKIGYPKASLSHNTKRSGNNAKKHIKDFENLVLSLAAKKGYNYVICGHTHEVAIREKNTPRGTINYLNSGDWLESLSSLEFNNGEWSLFSYMESELYQKLAENQENNGLPERRLDELMDYTLKNQKALMDEFIKLINT